MKTHWPRIIALLLRMFIINHDTKNTNCTSGSVSENDETEQRKTLKH